MKAIEFIIESNNTFYHGSTKRLPVGTILRPRDDYEDAWRNVDFYAALEKYRPQNKLSHKQSVFMCDCGGMVDTTA